MVYFKPENGEDLTISNLLVNPEYSYVMTLTGFLSNSVMTQSQSDEPAVAGLS
jgi:hypothetical protein